MLSSIHGGTVLLSAQYFATLAYSLRPRRLRLIPFVVIATLLFPLIAFPKGQAALAQASRAQANRASQPAALAQQQALQKKHNEGTLMILGGYPGPTYFNLAHAMAAPLAGPPGLPLRPSHTPQR